jgi:hypothetical protein
MTNQQHPITSTKELIDKWEGEWHHHRGQDTYEKFMANQAARWGADQELEACVGWLDRNGYFDSAHELRAWRRPKPPGLKEQALDELVAAERLYPADWSTIRRAIEALPND